MRRIVWLVAAALFGVAAFALYRAFSSPDFVAGLTAAAVGAFIKAIAPAFKPRPLTKEENDRNKSGKPPFSRDR
jgi:uncharacterized MnhB-related membrane protein